MSSLAVLRKALAMVEARDLEGFLGMLTEDCVIMKDNGEKIAAGSSELRAFYTSIFGEQTELKIHISNEFEAGSIVAVRETNKSLNVDGVEQDVDSVWIYRMAGDKIAYMHVFSPAESDSEAMTSLYEG